MAELIYWLWFSTLTDIAPAARAKIIKIFADAETVYNTPTDLIAKEAGLTEGAARKLRNRSLAEAEEIYTICEDNDIEIITIDDRRYPRQLSNIYAPPAVLFVKGRVPDMNRHTAIAVIGTRNASPYGIKMGRNISYEASKCGLYIVSGMSAGIETAAAQGTTDAGGTVIGVLGTPVTDASARVNSLVGQRGALISEYPPGTVPRKTFFREKNRIASGISAGVIVVEAPEKSGTRFFVEEALNQGREIFAVPGNADSDASAGTLKMIQDGAEMITHGWQAAQALSNEYPGTINPEIHEKYPDILTHIDTQAKSAETEPKHGNQQKVIDRKKSEGYIDISEFKSKCSGDEFAILKAIAGSARTSDEIIQETGLAAGKALAGLTMLQIKGAIRKNAGKGYTICEK